MRRLLVPLLLLAAMTPVQGHASAWTARAATYGTVVNQDVRVTMSDGVRLTVDVIRPAVGGVAAAGTFPVILTQTPYNKATALNFRSDYLVTRGYIQVIADVRGTGGSEGVWDSFGTREKLDGAELVEWAATQPWSDGTVGLHGTSYGAINQIFTAAQRPAGLKAIFPIVPMGDAYRDIVGSGGQINTSFIPVWLGLVTSLGMLPATYAAGDPIGAAVALASHAGGVAQFQASTVAKATSGGDTAFDGPFYRTRSPIEVAGQVNVPTFVVGGFYDLFQRGEPMLYNKIRATGTPTRLLMGPWYHTQVSISNGLPADGVPTLDALELRWMDRYVRGLPDPGMDVDVAPVTFIRLGGGHYERSLTWPPLGVTYQERYLHGEAVAGVQHGSLSSTSSSVSEAPDMLAWQPASGLCSRSVTQWTANGVHQGCEENQRTNDLGGLTYDLAASSPINLAGTVNAHLFVSTTGADAFVTARLEDVAPDGTSTQISAGWNVLSLRALDASKTVTWNGMIVQPYHPFTQASALPVAANTVYQLDIEIFPTAAVIATGHTLRLALQPSDAPHLTPTAPQAVALTGNILSVYHDAAHQSSVVLPLE